jgi:hypothetical protein
VASGIVGSPKLPASKGKEWAKKAGSRLPGDNYAKLMNILKAAPACFAPALVRKLRFGMIWPAKDKACYHLVFCSRPGINCRAGRGKRIFSRRGQDYPLFSAKIKNFCGKKSAKILEFWLGARSPKNVIFGERDAAPTRLCWAGLEERNTAVCSPLSLQAQYRPFTVILSAAKNPCFYYLKGNFYLKFAD